MLLSFQRTGTSRRLLTTLPLAPVRCIVHRPQRDKCALTPPSAAVDTKWREFQAVADPSSLLQLHHRSAVKFFGRCPTSSVSRGFSQGSRASFHPPCKHGAERLRQSPRRTGNAVVSCRRQIGRALPAACVLLFNIQSIWSRDSRFIGISSSTRRLSHDP